jgi:UDP-glucose 4-epimerase
MNVFVTGATGFIGKAVVTLFASRLSQGDCLVACGGPERTEDPFDLCLSARFVYRPLDVCDPESCWAELRCRGVLPDVVIHLAAHSAIRRDEMDPCVATRVNALGTHHLLDACPDGCRVVLASSVAVYGDAERTAGAWNETHPRRPTSAYGASKVAAEELLAAEVRQGRLSGVSLRLAAQVGPGSTHGLLHDIRQKLFSDEHALRLLGNRPGSCKPFTHVTDTAEAFWLVAREYWSGTYNCVARSPLTVAEVAELAMKTCGIRKPTVWSGPQGLWAGDNPYVDVDSSRLQLLGWSLRYETSREAVIAACSEWQA